MSNPATMARSGIPVRAARSDDAALCRFLESSAGLRFCEFGSLRELAVGEDRPLEFYSRALSMGHSLILARDGSDPVGFLCATLEGSTMHWWELGLRREEQGKGFGGVLIEAGIDHAHRSGARDITLTTFAEVPWNAPLYSRFGFVQVPSAALDERLASLLEAERMSQARGQRRCAMRLGRPGPRRWELGRRQVRFARA